NFATLRVCRVQARGHSISSRRSGMRPSYQSIMAPINTPPASNASESPAPFMVGEEGMTRPLRSYKIVTYGCQMNEYDSDIMRGVLTARGMVETPDDDNADVILVNTCAVRD